MNEAIAALAKAQTEMGKAIKNAKNPHLKSNYADLGSVMEACFDALHANGFAVMQPCGADERGQYVETILAHSSGHQFASRVHLVIGKNDMQGVGSAITYARRYGLLGMAGLAPEDDDGEATKAPQHQRNSAPPFDATAAENRIIAAINRTSGEPALTDLWKREADTIKQIGGEGEARIVTAFRARKAETEQKAA